MFAGVIQFAHFARYGIVAGDVCTFVEVAIKSCKSEILHAIVPTVFFGGYMLNLKRCERRTALRKEAILAPVSRALSH